MEIVAEEGEGRCREKGRVRLALLDEELEFAKLRRIHTFTICEREETKSVIWFRYGRKQVF